MCNLPYIAKRSLIGTGLFIVCAAQTSPPTDLPEEVLPGFDLVCERESVTLYEDSTRGLTLTRYYYDDEGRVLGSIGGGYGRLQDPNMELQFSLGWIHVYDDLGRLVRDHDSIVGDNTYTYLRPNLRVRYRSPRLDVGGSGQTWTEELDADGRIVASWQGDTPEPESWQTVRFSFDELGRRTSEVWAPDEETGERSYMNAYYRYTLDEAAHEWIMEVYNLDADDKEIPRERNRYREDSPIDVETGHYTQPTLILSSGSGFRFVSTFSYSLGQRVECDTEACDLHVVTLTYADDCGPMPEPYRSRREAQIESLFPNGVPTPP